MAELDQAPKGVDEPVACDWLLQILISVTNSTGIPCPITLNVGGILVSGELVSGLQYFEEFAQKMGSAVKESEREEIEAMFREMGQSFYAKEKSPEAPPPPLFIYKMSKSLTRKDCLSRRMTELFGGVA
jgi:hypothetical protein